MESNIGWENILSFEQGLLDVFEGDGLLFLDAESEDDGLDFVVGIVWLFVLIFGFDFLFGFELGEVIECFSSDHGFVGIQLKLIITLDGFNNLLNFVNSEFFDFVTIEEQRQLDKMIFVGGNFLIEELIMSQIVITEIVVDLLGDSWGHVIKIIKQQQWLYNTDELIGVGL